MSIEGSPEPLDQPETYFASTRRSDNLQLARLVEEIGNNPLVDTALEILGGWVAVLNEHRQVLAVNHALLSALGVNDPGRLLGLRPGEILDCIHAREHPGGCGTSRFCSSCGAVICILAAQHTGQAEERECVLTFRRDDRLVDRSFHVRCCPLVVGGEELILICMHDISDEKRRSALERTFLHDLSGVVAALGISAALLDPATSAIAPEAIRQLREAVDILVREVRVQQLLARARPEEYHLDLERCCPSEFLNRFGAYFTGHRSTHRQQIVLKHSSRDEPFESDLGLLMRVLNNMLINALEAGVPGDTVRIAAESTDEDVEFSVWNRALVPEAAALRMFQQYFSTKADDGRGMGTFSMKLIGEKLLKGTVSFTSAPEDGTTFRIRLPRRFPHPRQDAGGKTRA